MRPLFYMVGDSFCVRLEIEGKIHTVYVDTGEYSADHLYARPKDCRSLFDGNDLTRWATEVYK